MPWIQGVRVGDVRAGVSDELWLKPAGRAVLALLDREALESLHLRLFSLVDVLAAEDGDTLLEDTSETDVRQGALLERLIALIRLPLMAAALSSSVEDIHRRAEVRQRVTEEAHAKVAALSGAHLPHAAPDFYERAFNELRSTVAALLKEYGGIDVESVPSPSVGGADES